MRNIAARNCGWSVNLTRTILVLFRSQIQSPPCGSLVRHANLLFCRPESGSLKKYLRGYATMNLSDLEKVARGIVARGKGLLAADESSGTIKNRFDSIKLDSTEEHRRTYREMLFTAPGAQQWISGVIEFD